MTNKLKVVYALGEAGVRERFLKGEPYGLLRSMFIELPSGKVLPDEKYGSGWPEVVSPEDLKLLVEWATFPAPDEEDIAFHPGLGICVTPAETTPYVNIGFERALNKKLLDIHVGYYETVEEAKAANKRNSDCEAPQKRELKTFDSEAKVHELVEWEKARREATSPEVRKSLYPLFAAERQREWDEATRPRTEAEARKPTP